MKKLIKITSVFMTRFFSGLSPILLLVFLQSHKGTKFTGVYIMCFGLANVLYVAFQGYMPVTFARLFDSRRCNINLVKADLLLTIFYAVIVTPLFILISWSFSLNVNFEYAISVLFFLIGVACLNSLGKFFLNRGDINLYIMMVVFFPSMISFLSLFTSGVLNVKDGDFVGISDLALSFLLICILTYCLFCANYKDKNKDKNRTFYFFWSDFRERFYRTILSLSEQVDVIILPTLSLNSLVSFTYIKRILGVGSIASSIITKTFEKSIIKTNSANGLSVVRKYVAIIQILLSIGVVYYLFRYEPEFSGLNTSSDLLLLVSAALVSVLQILNAGKITVILKDKRKTKLAIVTMLFISICLFFIYFVFLEGFYGFCFLYIMINLSKVLVNYALTR
ncbi:hypothetical protein L2D39_12975 [Vibrio harveyi]|uniref:hypothetical protein n=1 Tax=Vibrio harveyi TaxID=669 RepID=UPI00111BFB08|nr:hypothetical protein [Vibrio harveyi]